MTRDMSTFRQTRHGRFVLYVLSVWTAVTIAAAERPNIVIFFADDAGYADFGFQPNCRPDFKTLTPHIDAIADAGVRCNNAYVAAPVCSPSRAGLMTGRDPQRYGHENNLPTTAKTGLPLSETFLPKRMQKLGYRTGIIGKWHLGYPKEFQPNQRGFDEFSGLLQGSRSYYPYAKPSDQKVMQYNGKHLPEEGYVTDRMGDMACDFIDANKAKPFFLFLSFTAPHGPLEPRKGESRTGHIKDERRRKYAGLVTAMDDNVGKVNAKLKSLGLHDNTLVVFTNDKGGPAGMGTDNYPLRGHKGNVWEGGVRVPWVMSWPKVIKPGSVIEHTISTLDFAPTCIDLAGGVIEPNWQLDGTSLKPLMQKPDRKAAPRTLYWRRAGTTGAIALRDGRWKLIRYRDGKEPTVELFDLHSDVSEATNLAATRPELLSRLSKKLSDWESDLVTPLWGPGSPDFVHTSKSLKWRGR
jgi:arylsulfatase A-like enzyme